MSGTSSLPKNSTFVYQLSLFPNIFIFIVLN